MGETDATAPVRGLPSAAGRTSTIDDRECDSVASVTKKIWEDLYKTEMPRLVRHLMKCFGNSDMCDAADAAHSAFAELFADWDKVRSPRAWLWKVAFRLMLHQAPGVQYPLDVLRQEPGAAPASLPLELREETQAVLTALRKLPLAQRQVLALLYDGFTYSEIAEITGKNEAAVRKNAERARKTMTELLGIT